MDGRLESSTMRATKSTHGRRRAGAIVRRVTALVCVLWLGGLGCLLGCGSAVFAVPAVSTDGDAPAESCPMDAGDACCHRAEGNRKTASVDGVSTAPGGMNCCPLSGQTADPARRLRLADAPVVLSVNRALPAISVESPVTAPPAMRRVPDRGSTRLLCCVFLI